MEFYFIFKFYFFENWYNFVSFEPLTVLLWYNWSILYTIQYNILSIHYVLYRLVTTNNCKYNGPCAITTFYIRMRIQSTLNFFKSLVPFELKHFIKQKKQASIKFQFFHTHTQIIWHIELDFGSSITKLHHQISRMFN